MDSLDFHKYLHEPELLNATSLVVLKKMVEIHPSFQMGWILLLKNLKLLNSPEFELYLNKAAFWITDRRKLYYFIHVESKLAERELKLISNEYTKNETYSLSEENKPEDNLSHLAESLRPKNTTVKTNYDESKKNEKQNSDNDFVTETLAKIYIKQSLFKQAIASYEKLGLKFPEKNAYFVARIKEIKELTK
ncbi:MAG: hypothetical protein ACK5JS_05675 [Mangrovibacterium sp.]